MPTEENKFVRRKKWNEPNSNFKGYVKKFNVKTKKMKDTYYNVIPFTEEVNQLSKKLEDPESMGMRKGSGLKAHKDGTEKLRALNVDPLDILVKHLNELDRLIAEELNSGQVRSKYIYDLQVLKLRILETILPYRYGKAPITTIEQIDVREPIEIVLRENVDESGSKKT